MKSTFLRKFAALFIVAVSLTVALPPAAAADAALFLRGQPGALALDTNAPTSATASIATSPAVGRAQFVEIGTWTAAPLSGPLQVMNLGPVIAWVGQAPPVPDPDPENCNSRGTFFDVRLELLKNGQVLATGLSATNFLPGVRAGLDRAVAVAVPLDSGTQNFQAGDVLALRVLTRIGGFALLRTTPGVRLYFDSTAQASRLTLPMMAAAELSITSPANLSYFATGPITVTGMAGNSVNFVDVNGVRASLANGTFTAAVPLREGNNIITAVGRDAASNALTASINVTLDTQPPRVAIDSPRDGATVSERHITVTGLINDTVVGTVNGSQARVTVNGFSAGVANRTFLAADIPLEPGTNTIVALGTDRAGNSGSTSIKVFYNTNIAPRIQLVSGNHQAGPIGALLPQPLVVRVTDNAGNPCPNKKVIFKVCQNDGLVTGPTNTARSLIVMSGADGLARVQFRLGTRSGAGNHQVQANVVGFEGTAMFCASATPAAPGLLTLDAGNNQSGLVGQPLARPFVTIVVDSGNNRLGNVPITYTVTQGGGRFAPSPGGEGRGEGGPTLTVNTDSDGRALAVLTLGPEAGIENNVVEVTYPGNTGLPVTFVASGKLPADPAQTTISGVVLDNTDLPVPGATMSLVGTPFSVRSDANGYFQIKPAPVGAVKLHADGSTVTRPGTWVNLEFDLNTIPGQDNGVGMPVRLLPMDLAQGLFVDQTRGGILTLRQAPGYSLAIAPGSVTFPGGGRSGLVSVTVVHPDKIPDVPNFGQQPRFIISIQPAGAIFNPPAPMCIPNLDALPPGQKTEMYSFDHDLGSFISIGTGTVSEDGMMVCSDPGVGIIKGGWHCGGNPAEVAKTLPTSVSVTPLPILVCKDQEVGITASGSPQPPYVDKPYRWAAGGNVTINDPEGDGSATLRGIQGGKQTSRVTYLCKSAQPATVDFEVTVVEVRDVVFSKPQICAHNCAGASSMASATIQPAGRRLVWSIQGDTHGAIIDAMSGMVTHDGSANSGMITVRGADSELPNCYAEGMMTIRAKPTGIASTTRGGGLNYGARYTHTMTSSGGSLAGVVVAELITVARDDFATGFGGVPLGTLTAPLNSAGSLDDNIGTPSSFIDVNDVLPVPCKPGLPGIIDTPQVLYWRCVDCSSWVAFANVNITVTLSGTPPSSFVVTTVDNGVSITEPYTGPALSTCTGSLSPASAMFTANAAGGTVSVTAASDCGWTATSDSPWLRVVTGTPSCGNGTVTYLVEANSTAAARIGRLSIAGQSFTVNQAAP